MRKIKSFYADPKVEAEEIEDYIGKEIELFFKIKLTKKQAATLQDKYGDQCKEISDGVELISKLIEAKKKYIGIIRWQICNLFYDCDGLVHRVNNPNDYQYIGYDAYAAMHGNSNGN